MPRIAVALSCLALSGAVAPAASAAPPLPPPLIFDVVHASGTVRLEFHGDPATGCVALGRCGASGTMTTTLVSTKIDIGFLNRWPSGTVGDFPGIELRTQATISEAGLDTPCVDSFRFRYPPLGLSGTRSRVSFQFDLLQGVDPFATHCAGPRGRDIAELAAFRHGYPFTHFTHRRVRLDLDRTASFHAAGFAGTVTTDIHLTLRRNLCRSRCPVAVGL